MRIAVGIGARILKTADGGRSWIEGARAVPRQTEPRVRSPAGLDLPAPTGWAMSDVHIGVGGVGFAVGCEPARGEGERRSSARFLLTRDGGVTWQPIQPDIGIWGRLRAGPSWLPEAVDSIAVLPDGLVAFVWEDPWFFEGSRCHIVLSTDAGSRWRYARLPDGCTWMACGSGPVRVFGPGRVAVRSGSGAFRCETVRLEWNRPRGFEDKPLPLRFAQFASEAEGLAIVVSWHREESQPPLVGLARSQDGGRLWKVVSTWEGPPFTDLNRRHELALDVR